MIADNAGDFAALSSPDQSREVSMPLFAVLLEDQTDNAAEIRRNHMAAHLDFLDRHAAAIRAAGPLHEGSSGQPAGGLMLIEAADAEAVQTLTQEDPFWHAGLRRSVRVLEWRQVFADGRRRS
jgi:uncharacterized protein